MTQSIIETKETKETRGVKRGSKRGKYNCIRAPVDDKVVEEKRIRQREYQRQYYLTKTKLKVKNELDPDRTKQNRKPKRKSSLKKEKCKHNRYFYRCGSCAPVVCEVCNRSLSKYGMIYHLSTKYHQSRMEKKKQTSL